MLGPAFFLLIGILIAITSHRKKALWLTRAGVCCVILAPVSFFLDHSPETSGNVALAAIVMSAAIFCVIVGMVKREQFYKADH